MKRSPVMASMRVSVTGRSPTADTTSGLASSGAGSPNRSPVVRGGHFDPAMVSQAPELFGEDRHVIGEMEKPRVVTLLDRLEVHVDDREFGRLWLHASHDPDHGLGIPGRRGSRPLLTIDPICFIILRISANCFTSRFTSDTVVPEPAAIRRRRDPLISTGSARSAFVIDEMIASILRISRSASGPSGSCFARPPNPGIIFNRSPSGPIFLTCCSCE